MSYVLGLTGSIGMGKSTTARMFAEEGVPVWDADAAGHRLYSAGGAAVAEISRIRREVVSGGAVDRAMLKDWIAEDPAALTRIEGVVQPLVAADRASFLRETAAPVVLLDIPLLFETGGERMCDAVVVVTAPPEVQRARVLARLGMTEAHLEALLAKQMPDADKRARADYLVETSTLEQARAAVRDILRDIRRKLDA